MESFEIRKNHIELNKLLKVLGWASTGGHAKQLIQEGHVLRNNALETRVRAKLVAGDIIELEGQQVQLLAGSDS